MKASSLTLAHYRSREVFDLKVYQITPIYGFRLPVVADAIKPELFEEKQLSEVLNVEVYEGGRRKRFGELFKVKEAGEAEETTLELIGDFSKVRRVGRRMSRGLIRVKGAAGIAFGEAMKGGRIVVEGLAGPWLGAKMRGGSIEVYGDAGDFLGGAYRGEDVGMRGGSMVVHGRAGWNVGYRMKNGLIIVEGDVGGFPGVHMSGGTIYVKGGCGKGAGAFMKNGRIVLLGYVPSILASFSFEEIRPSIRVESERLKGRFYMFIGDLSEKGSGRLFINADSNKHLSFYEQLIEEL
jgi:formylmethanofuran dehydrogenase subunit C